MPRCFSACSIPFDNLMKIVTLLFLAICANLTVAHPHCKHYALPFTSQFCSRPPVDVVVPASYTGTWYQIYASESAIRFTSTQCVTANYTASASGLDVLNCFSTSPTVNCVTGTATLSPDSSSRLTVKFPGSPGGPYNIAALLGDPEYGYAAAAVYSCTVIAGKARESWFILSRVPYRTKFILYRLLHKLRCKGYSVSLLDFLPTRQGAGCNYFFGPNGFTTRGPRPSF